MALYLLIIDNVPVQLQTTVNEVKWDGNGVKVVTNKEL